MINPYSQEFLNLNSNKTYFFDKILLEFNSCMDFIHILLQYILYVIFLFGGIKVNIKANRIKQ
jgi:hypothetical protein